MAIDMRNLLTGFSGQLISAQSAALDVSTTDASGTRLDLAACVLREEDVLDVGFVVCNTPTGSTSYAVRFGKDKAGATAHSDAYYSSKVVDNTVSAGTVYRVSDGSLSWTGTADTETERELTPGDIVTFTYLDTGDAAAAGTYVIPFAIMWPKEPLDPIA